MNKEVLLNDDKVIVKMSNGSEKEVKPLDNLIEILMMENVIETMENVVNELVYCSNRFRKSKFLNLSSVPFPTISSIVSPTLFVLFNEFPDIINTKFGFMDKEKFIVLFTLLFLPVGYKMSKKWYEEYKDEVNSENGRQVALMKIRENLVIQRDKLEVLKRNGNIVDISYFDLGTINDDDILDVIQTHINMYYEIGYNLKFYYTYYMTNGELPIELREEYNENGQEIIKDFLSKNGPKVKKLGSK